MNWRFWQRQPAAARVVQKPSRDEEQLRVAARRRLIGAGVLVLLTVLIFPWVFQSQPRPVNDDIVVEVPRKDNAAALPAPQPPTKNTIHGGVTPVSPQKSSGESAETQPSNGSSAPEMVPQKATAPQISAATPAPPAAAASVKEPAATAPVAPPAAKAQVSSGEAAKAKAAPAQNGTPAAPGSGRFVVQVGAFADASKARETRLKIEKAGLKTYSQAVDSPKGRIWRVRVGPFDNRAAAEKAKAELVLQGYAPGIVEL